MNSLVLSPHNDDEALFAAYTLIREKSLIAIVTDSWIQPNRGDLNCSAEERWQESVAAAAIIGCPIVRLGIRDDSLTKEALIEALSKLGDFDRIYAPAIQGGNWQHDLVAQVALEVFGDRVTQYTTYTKTELWTKGDIEVVPTPEELEIKRQALMCYKSQINLSSTRPHFEAVFGKSEWLLK